MAKILIVGPGYVGGRLAQNLSSEHEVWTLNRSGFQSPLVHNLVHDLKEPLEEKLSGFDEVVIALAPKSPDLDVYRNTYVEGTKKVLQALDSPPNRLIFCSSTSVYPHSDGQVVDEFSPICPISKTRGGIMAEAESLIKEQENGIIVRFGGIYGPGRTSFISRILSSKVVKSSTPRYTNRIHVDDCVGVLEHLRDPRIRAGVYNGVDSYPCDKNEVIDWVWMQSGQPVPMGQVSDPQSAQKKVSNAKLLETGFSFKYPTFKAGYQNLLSDSVSG